MTDYVGTAGDDIITGSSQADNFYLTQGGDDAADGKRGDDYFDLGAAFTADDSIVGGEGSDYLALNGDYKTDVVFTATTISGIDVITMQAGENYRLVLDDANIAAGETLFIAASGLGARDGARVTATGETDGQVWFNGGGGDDKLLGGAMADVFNDPNADADRGSDTIKGGDGGDYILLSNSFEGSDKIDGGAGLTDQVVILTGYPSGLTVDGGMLKGVEVFQINGTGEASFALTMTDSGLKPTLGLWILATTLGTTALDFDASAETDGTYRVETAGGADTLVAGALSDTLRSGTGDDLLTGGGGADRLEGATGSDRFIYLATADSTAGGADLIVDLDGSDVIDLSAIDAKASKAGDQAFNLVAAFTGKEAQAVLSYDGGLNLTSLSLDTNGDAIADSVITMVGDQTGFGGFAL